MYLGLIVLHNDNVTPAMLRNLKQVRSAWGRVNKFLAHKGVPVPVAGKCYQVVIAGVILYKSESWLSPPQGLP